MPKKVAKTRLYRRLRYLKKKYSEASSNRVEKNVTGQKRQLESVSANNKRKCCNYEESVLKTVPVCQLENKTGKSSCRPISKFVNEESKNKRLFEESVPFK